MNGVHDMGGMHGFGPVVRERDEPVFHADWERKVYAITRVRGWLGWGLDEMRHAVETMPPSEYLTASYYERWLFAMEKLLVAKGVLSQAEIDARLADLEAHPERSVPRRENPVRLAEIEGMLRGRANFDRPVAEPARFQVGDRVLTRREQPQGHTRLPRYARGRQGVVHAARGGYIFPDTHAHCQGEQPQHLYTVCFDGRELWGESAESRELVYLDLWEAYLEPAAAAAQA